MWSQKIAFEFSKTKLHACAGKLNCDFLPSFFISLPRIPHWRTFYTPKFNCKKHWDCLVARRRRRPSHSRSYPTEHKIQFIHEREGYLVCAKKRGWRERRKVRKSEKHQTTTFQLKAYKSLQSLNEIIPSHSHSHIPAAGSAHNSTIFNFICRLMPLSYFHFRSHSVWMKYWWNFQFSKSRGKFACTQTENWSEIFMSPAQQSTHKPFENQKRVAKWK